MEPPKLREPPLSVPIEAVAPFNPRLPPLTVPRVAAPFTVRVPPKTVEADPVLKTKVTPPLTVPADSALVVTDPPAMFVLKRPVTLTTPPVRLPPIIALLPNLVVPSPLRLDILTVPLEPVNPNHAALLTAPKVPPTAEKEALPPVTLSTT